MFAEDRIRRAKDELKQEIAHRDDDPGDQLDRIVAEIVYGKTHPFALLETAATVDAISGGRASELLGMERLEFIQYADRLGIPYFDFTDEELAAEIAASRRW